MRGCRIRGLIDRQAVIDKDTNVPSKDSIDRQAVLDRIRESIEIYSNQYTTDMLNMWGLFTQFIKEMPPVKPREPKTGHWILQPSNKEQGERDFIWWKCSECGQVIYSETEKDRREYHAFCGRCGAKIESEDKE